MEKDKSERPPKKLHQKQDKWSNEGEENEESNYMSWPIVGKKWKRRNLFLGQQFKEILKIQKEILKSEIFDLIDMAGNW